MITLVKHYKFLDQKLITVYIKKSHFFINNKKYINFINIKIYILIIKKYINQKEYTNIC